MLYSIIHLERQFQLDSGSFEGNNSWDYDRANLLQSNLTLHAALTIGQGIDSISKVFFVNTDLSKKRKKEKSSYFEHTTPITPAILIIIIITTIQKILYEFMFNKNSLSHHWIKEEFRNFEFTLLFPEKG